MHLASSLRETIHYTIALHVMPVHVYVCVLLGFPFTTNVHTILCMVMLIHYITTKLWLGEKSLNTMVTYCTIIVKIENYPL